MNKFSDISYRYIKYNKKRSLTIIISIIISVFLIFGIGTLGFSINDSILGRALEKGDYHVVFDKVSNEDYKLLKENVNIKEICAVDDSSRATLSQSKSNPRTLMIRAFDEINNDIFSYSVVDGDYPEKSNEIMIEDVARYYMDKQYNIGDDITLNTGKKEITYKIVGFFSKADSSKKNSEFLAVTIKDQVSEEPSWTVYVNFKDHKSIKASAEKISSDFGISIARYNDEVLSFYEQDDSSRTSSKLLLMFCVLLIAVSEIIIRTTIHMSVVERTRDFGILKCLGISQKKLKRILRKEALTLGVIAVILGIPICFAALKIGESIINGRTDIGQYFKVSFYPNIALVAIVLVFIAIIFSLMEPGRILSKISPLEALRSNFAIKKEKIKVRKGGIIFRKIFGVEGEYAYKNIMRSKGKFISILVAFTISIAVFTCFNGILNSFMQKFETETTKETVNYNGYYDANVTMEDGYNKNISMETCLSEINNIEGVIDAKERYMKYYPYFDEKYSVAEAYEKSSIAKRDILLNLIQGYDTDELKLLKENVIDGSFEVDKLKEDEVILCNYDILKDENNKTEKVKIYNINVGDEIAMIDYSKFKERADKLIVMNGNEYEDIAKGLYAEGEYKKVKVVAIVDKDAVCDNSPSLIFSKEGYRKIVPESIDDTGGINIKIEGGEISGALDKYINESLQYGHLMYDDENMYSVTFLKGVWNYVNIIIVVVGLICAFNIMNTIATNQISRKKEFATLRTIGMSKKRICKMIALEGTLASIIASIVGVIIGNGLGYYFIEGGIFGDAEISYTIPYLPMVLGIITVLGISLAASIIPIIKIGNQNIVEGIRDNE